MYTGTRPYPDFSRKFFIREVLILNAIAESTILTVSVGSSRLKLAARPVTTTPISSVRNLTLANARTAARLSGSVLSTKTKHLLSYKVHLHPNSADESERSRKNKVKYAYEKKQKSSRIFPKANGVKFQF